MDTEEISNDLPHDSAETEPDSAVVEDAESLDPQIAEPEISDSENTEVTEPILDEVSEPVASKSIDDISTTDEVDALLEEYETNEHLGKEPVTDPEPEEQEQEQEQEQEPEPETETEEIPLADKAEDEDDTKPVKRRFAAQNDLENEFVSVKQRNPDLSIEMALAMAKDNLGIVDPQEEAQDAQPEAEAQEEPQESLTSAEAQVKADELAEAHRVALKDLDFEKVADLAAEIRNMDRRVIELQHQEAESLSQAEEAFNNQFDADQEKAIGLYPDAAKANSKFAARMREIDQSLKETGNDLYYSSDKVSKIAMMAANEMGIPPARPGAKPKANKVSPPRKSPVPPPSASGAARTNTTTASETQRASEAAIASINSIDDLENFLDKEIGGTY